MKPQDREAKRRKFLTKAAEADKHAARARDPEMRASWEKIAEQYRKLADGT